jgi:Fic family protein
MYENRFAQNEEYKAKIDKYRPLSDHILQQIKAYYRISLTYTSNAIEGSSLSVSETKIIIEDGITIGGKPLREHLEVIGHSEAYDLLYKQADSAAITGQDILDLHHLFYKHIDENQAGVYRDCNVVITGSEFELPKYTQIPELMRIFTGKIPQMKANLHPVEFAAILHKELVTIHPFIDGNGRTARLLMNLALLQSGYNIVTIPPVVRNDYISALREAQLNNNIEPFVNFISEMILESQKEYLKIIERLV